MFIVTVTHIFLAKGHLLVPINLNHPTYRISFSPDPDAPYGADIIEQPTLKQAKRFAERYYSKWLEVNRG